MPRILNLKTLPGRMVPEGAVYIGRDRSGRSGNPFTIGPDGSREEVIVQYRIYLAGRPDLLAALPELAGRHLVCWCAPLACHGDVLLELLKERNLAKSLGYEAGPPCPVDAFQTRKPSPCALKGQPTYPDGWVYRFENVKHAGRSRARGGLADPRLPDTDPRRSCGAVPG